MLWRVVCVGGEVLFINPNHVVSIEPSEFSDVYYVQLVNSDIGPYEVRGELWNLINDLDNALQAHKGGSIGLRYTTVGDLNSVEEKSE